MNGPPILQSQAGQPGICGSCSAMALALDCPEAATTIIVCRNAHVRKVIYGG